MAEWEADNSRHYIMKLMNKIFGIPELPPHFYEHRELIRLARLKQDEAAMIKSDENVPSAIKNIKLAKLYGEVSGIMIAADYLSKDWD